MADTNNIHYSIDADPQGIRAMVADAISGALAFGAQGVNPPPKGHWLTPFWNAARADAQPAATVYTMEALVPGSGVKHHAQLNTPLPAGTKLYAAPQPNAAPPASQRDELLQVALDFISTLTGMTPPPIEVAPPEVFAPFYSFVDRVQAITSQPNASKEAGNG